MVIQVDYFGSFSHFLHWRDEDFFKAKEGKAKSELGQSHLLFVPLAIVPVLVVEVYIIINVLMSPASQQDYVLEII